MTIATLRRAAAALTIAGGLAAASTTGAYAQACPEQDLPPSGTIAGEMTSVGIIVGATWGNGTLTMTDGTSRDFKIGGAQLLDVGVATQQFKGEVYNLQNIEDFAGDYGTGQTGVTLIEASANGTILSNPACVYINMAAESQGVRLTAPAPGGVEIRWAE